jgi:hypothetical protein
MYVSKTQMESRVRKGVALLDAKCPGWHRKVKLSKLDLYQESPDNKGNSCILGQLFGDFFEATSEIGLTKTPWLGYIASDNQSLEAAAPYGLSFNCNILEKLMSKDPENETIIKDTHNQLTEVWKAAIRKRRGK